MIAKISGTMLHLFSVLVYRTCRFHVSGIDQIEKMLKRGEPVIITSWHGMTMMIIGFLRKKMDLSSFVGIIPNDYRGDILDVFGQKLGVEPIPLDLSGDSTLGTGRKLVGLVRKISSGKNMVIHPDGPAGPAYVVKPGLSFLAKKTGAAILPLGCYCRHAYHVPRWDRYTLPLPFSKVHIQVGNLLTVPENLQDLSVINQQLTDILHRVSAQASANYYEL
ncbi:MAG: hypothetical protein KAU23_10895 [Anaerolineales bacterium]|nr:hypothetical protein [Anaerolineales bacterium]